MPKPPHRYYNTFNIRESTYINGLAWLLFSHSFTLTMNQRNDSVDYEKFDVSVQVTAADVWEQLCINQSFVEVASQPCTAFE